LGSKGLFSPFCKYTKVYFPCSMKNSRTMNISHADTDFGSQIPFLEAYFCVFEPQKYIFLTSCEIPDHTIKLILGPKFRFWALTLFSAYLTPKNIVFLTPCEIPDRWIYHTIILILDPKFRFWGLTLFSAFLNPKSIYYLARCKIPERWVIIARLYWFWAPNIVLGPFTVFSPLRTQHVHNFTINSLKNRKDNQFKKSFLI
jgi:hypothetical protein